MNSKFFIVEFQFDDRTRWLTDDVAISRAIARKLESEAGLASLGSWPEVKVSSLEGKAVVDANALDLLQKKSGLTLL